MKLNGLCFGSATESGIARFPEVVNTPGHFFLVSGPSGVGKGTILEAVKQDAFLKSQITTVRSLKNRLPRPGEEQNRSDSVFVSPEEFEAKKRNNELFQWLAYAKNQYGTLKQDIVDSLNKGGVVLFELSAKVARQIQKAYPEKTTTVFIAPPDQQTLYERLKGRGTESPEAIAERIQNADGELALMPEFDHVVVNHTGKLAEAVEQVKTLMRNTLAKAAGHKNAA